LLLSAPGIRLTRIPYEEPYHLNLRIEASNGRLAGELEYYCPANDLTTLGRQLAVYTGPRNPEVTYELGSEDPSERFGFFLSLRVRPLDYKGNCVILLRFNNNQQPPGREVSEFAIEADAAALKRLGDQLVDFGELFKLVLDWRVREEGVCDNDEASPE
jgi:hypothetical protein